MSELHLLQTWVAPLLAQLSGSARRQLLLRIARELRASQVANIKAQRNPDGQAWEPRKQARRNLRGRIRNQAQARKQGMDMFRKLRSPRYLQAQATPDEAVVGFAARVQRIARVHHLGLPDRVRPGGPIYQYPARELLGIPGQQIHEVQELVLRHLSAAMP